MISVATSAIDMNIVNTSYVTLQQEVASLELMIEEKHLVSLVPKTMPQ